MTYKIIGPVMFMLLAAACEKPVEAVAETKGLEAQFLGEWQVAFPEGEGVIVNVPITACDAPLIISSDARDTIIYNSPKGAPVSFELMEFNGRITWMPENGPTSITERKDDGVFWLYGTDGMGKADWNNPKEYRRCDLVQTP